MAASANEGEDEIVGINVTPLVDIVLVLLIIFMVTANTIVRETVEVDLPTAGKKGDATAPLLMLTMNEDAKVFLDGVEVADAVLLTKLKDSVLKDKDVRAIIGADQSLNYARVVSLIDLVKEAGVAKFSLNLQKPAVSTTLP